MSEVGECVVSQADMKVKIFIYSIISKYKMRWIKISVHVKVKKKRIKVGPIYERRAKQGLDFF